MSRPKYLTEEEIEALLNASDSGDDFSGGSDDEFVPEEEVRDLLSSDSEEEVEEIQTSAENIASESQEENVSCSSKQNIDPSFVSKDGILWQANPVHDRSRRFGAKNVISLRPGTTRFAKSRVDDIKDAFMLIFPPPIENMILKHSNAYAASQLGKDYKQINSNMLRAYIAVLILAGR